MPLSPGLERKEAQGVLKYEGSQKEGLMSLVGEKELFDVTIDTSLQYDVKITFMKIDNDKQQVGSGGGSGSQNTRPDAVVGTFRIER
jgi:hypothetical protein